MAARKYRDNTRARGRVALTHVGAALLAASFWAGAANAADVEPVLPDGIGKVAPGYITLAGVFAEGTYVGVEQKDRIPNPDSSDTYGVRLGAVFALPKAGMFVIPSVEFSRTDATGSNAFAMIDSDSTVRGGELKLVFIAASNLFVHAGASGGSGQQDLRFNKLVPSTTNLHNYSAYAGADMVVYDASDITVSVVNELSYNYLVANFDPNNTVDRGSSRIWSNELGINGAWEVHPGTKLRAGVSWASFLGVREMIGEVSPDRNFGILSLGASQSITDSVSLYGSVGRVVFDSKRDVSSAKIGVMAVF